MVKIIDPKVDMVLTVTTDPVLAKAFNGSDSSHALRHMDILTLLSDFVVDEVREKLSVLGVCPLCDPEFTRKTKIRFIDRGETVALDCNGIESPAYVMVLFIPQELVKDEYMQPLLEDANR